MKELNVEELEGINGGSVLAWATATVSELGLAAAATAEVPPVSAGLAAAGAIGAAGIAIYEAFN